MNYWNTVETTPLLSVDSVTLRFAGITALLQVSLRVEAATITGLVGPNGAGKSTLLNCIAGRYRPDAGRIVFRGRDITQLRAASIFGLGLSRTFQSLGLFKTMTVFENVMMGFPARGIGFLSSAMWLPRVRRFERSTRERADALLVSVGLSSVSYRRVGDLPYGLQKRVELARAIASDPRLLLIDEPATGLSRQEVEGLMEFLVQVARDTGAALLIVDHNMSLMMKLAQEIVVLDNGRVLTKGTPAEVQADEQVIRTYLGLEM